MTTTTAPSRTSRRSSRGFTLVEVLIAMTLATTLLAVAGATIFSIARGSESLINYSEMNTQSRQVLNNLGSTLRSGSTVLSATEDEFTFIRLTETGDPETLSFTYDPARRTLILERADGTKQTILEDVTALSFNYFTYRQLPTTEPLEIKHVQLEAELTRRVMALSNRNYLVSARFMLRNKRVNDG